MAITFVAGNQTVMQAPIIKKEKDADEDDEVVSEVRTHANKMPLHHI